MFESVTEKPAEKALDRAAMIFRVLGTFACIALALGLVMRLSGDRRYGFFALAWYATFAALAFVTAVGIDRQQLWGMRLGYTLGFLSLINIPIGTVIGIAVILYIQRASKAGLFGYRSPPD